jgi:hypothetical protein
VAEPHPLSRETLFPLSKFSLAGKLDAHCGLEIFLDFVGETARNLADDLIEEAIARRLHHGFWQGIDKARELHLHL